MIAIEAIENRREVSSSWVIGSGCSELEEVSKDNLSCYLTITGNNDIIINHSKMKSIIFGRCPLSVIGSIR